MSPLPPALTSTALASTPHELSLHTAVLAAAPPLARPASPSTLTRYLRARSHDPAAAAAMLAASDEFFAASPPPETCGACVRSPRSHSFYPIGPTASGEPVAYSNYAGADTAADSNVVHMRFAMDRLFREGVPRLARMTWVMDMRFFGAKHVSPTVARKVLGLFAEHYPERLGCAVVYDAPLIFSGLFRAVKLFADPVTVRKVVFVRHDLKRRRAELEAVGISGECLDRLLKEIDDARADEATFASKVRSRVLSSCPLSCTAPV
jgi:CRAL/TRIO domain